MNKETIYQNALRSTSLPLFCSPDSPFASPTVSEPHQGSLASKVRATFSCRPEFACLVCTRVQLSLDTCPEIRPFILDNFPKHVHLKCKRKRKAPQGEVNPFMRHCISEIKWCTLLLLISSLKLCRFKLLLFMFDCGFLCMIKVHVLNLNSI